MNVITNSAYKFYRVDPGTKKTSILFEFDDNNHTITDDFQGSLAIYQ